MSLLSGRVAIVTGAGRGIGRAMALHMAGEGACVVVNDLGGDVDGSGAGRIADEVVQEIRDAGGEAAPSYDSVATVEGGRAIFQVALDAFGRLDVLGEQRRASLRDQTLFNMEEDAWDAVIDVHLRGHYCCTRPFVRYIREQNDPGKRIICFSSVSGLRGNFGQSNYGAAKAGIAGFSRVVAREVQKYGATQQRDLARRGHAHDDPADGRSRRRDTSKLEGSAGRNRSLRWSAWLASEHTPKARHGPDLPRRHAASIGIMQQPEP